MGMSVFRLRKFIAVALVLLFPLSLWAADTGSALLHSQGGVWVNGNEVAGSVAVFPGDTVETKPGFVANLDSDGSSVLIQPESILKFQGDYLVLEHGIVSVGTSASLSVHVNCIRVEPLSNERTQYDVADVSGKVEVAAHKNDVRITQSGAGKASTTTKTTEDNSSPLSNVVHEGEQATRDETQACGAAERPESPGHVMNTKWMVAGGGAVVGGVILCLILCKGSKSSPVSPSQP